MLILGNKVFIRGMIVGVVWWIKVTNFNYLFVDDEYSALEVVNLSGRADAFKKN